MLNLCLKRLALKNIKFFIITNIPGKLLLISNL